MTACTSQCVLLTWGDNAHTARGDGTDSGCVGSGNPPHITCFSSHSFSHLHVRLLSFHSVCLCLHRAPTCVYDCVLQRKVKKKQNIWVCFPVLSVSAYMPLNTPCLYIVGFVVETDKYYWPVHNIFCSFILPDVIFPIVLMIHVSTHVLQNQTIWTTHILN